ncbi:uncharacterized protein LOC113859417 [Abrus precatorius]|uniref:Uncharacterized protein LOC113859417 n=1 Tax=Abrus precatorius TaxID=3816 RepID=A0A8B8L040_ABRPR|nr:uncharacterized protein LOC113859417 [Abrus precatorius]
MPKEKEDSSCTPSTVGQNREEKTQEQLESIPTQTKGAKNVERAISLPFPQSHPTKRRLKGNEKVNMGRNVSVLFEKQKSMMLEKCKDLGTFTILCIIGNNRIKNGMLDLGASINIMSLSIFTSLSLGPLQPTGVVIQLANRSITNLAWIVEDVLVKVNDLIFLADFYILDMQEGESMKSVAPITLGRPFLKTTRTKIDVHARTLTIEFGDNIVCFNILDAMKHPSEEHSTFQIDLFDDLIDEQFYAFLEEEFSLNFLNI